MVWDPEEGPWCPRAKGSALGDTAGKKREVPKRAYKVKRAALKTRRHSKPEDPVALPFLTLF